MDHGVREGLVWVAEQAAGQGISQGEGDTGDMDGDDVYLAPGLVPPYIPGGLEDDLVLTPARLEDGDCCRIVRF